ncbi:hypothetical protein ACJMK2_025007 [Sinanodonta woodiana]|uniref:Parvovirus non-structural protein 1 helicase domain-containing protein n=1 Tax=Sinanodonta woodiana TaxID=1069815 RepID=A0ABD3XJ20_SINWO
MTGYLKKPPRQLIGTTSNVMDRFYVEQPQQEELGKKSLKGTKRRREDQEDEKPDAPNRQRVGNGERHRPRPGDKLKVLMDLMKKYKRNDIHKLLKEAIRKDEDEDYDTVLDLLAVPTNRIVAQNAAKLLCSAEPRFYHELFMEETTEEEIDCHLDTNKLLSVEESHTLFKEWAKEKRSAVKSGTYWLVCLFAVIFRKVPKRNTFLCVGAASSGKTFWTDPVLWLQQYVGLSANDSHFCFAELAHSKVGLINELKFNRDTLEIYKQIGEGKDCMVPVKNQGLGSCDSQLIVITVNQETWAALPEGREAMEERSFYFHFLSKSKVLAEHKSRNTNKGINPYWLKGVFSVLTEALHNVNLPELLEKRDFTLPIWRHLDELLLMNEAEDGIYGEIDWSSDSDIEPEEGYDIPDTYKEDETAKLLKAAAEQLIEIVPTGEKYKPIIEPITPVTFNFNDELPDIIIETEMGPAKVWAERPPKPWRPWELSPC